VCADELKSFSKTCILIKTVSSTGSRFGFEFDNYFENIDWE